MLKFGPHVPEQDADELTFPMSTKNMWGRLELEGVIKQVQHLVPEVVCSLA